MDSLRTIDRNKLAENQGGTVVMGSYGEELKLDVSSLEFSDYDDNKIQLSKFKGDVVILVGGQQKATEEATKWDLELQKECKSRKGIKVFGVAFVGKLPIFVPKRVVKKALKDGPPFIDWDGIPIKPLGVVDKKLPYVFVIDKQEFLRFRMLGTFSEESLKEVLRFAGKP